MSYCRWSSDNHKCDAYVYDSIDGVTLHLAGNRHVGDIPIVPVFGSVSEAEFLSASKAQREFLIDAKIVPIKLPYAGESFTFDSPGECAVMIKELIEIGYNIPNWVIGILLEEQEELDKPVNTED